MAQLSSGRVGGGRLHIGGKHICYLHKYKMIFRQIDFEKLDKHDFQLGGSVI